MEQGYHRETYTYDPVGNRLTKEHYIINMPDRIPVKNSFAKNSHTEKRRTIDVTETYCYNERNELTLLTKSSGTVSYRYDTNGNLLCEETQEAGNRAGKKSVKEYSYDLLNRLTYTGLPNGREYENHYDGEGLRTEIREQNKSTTFLYHNGEILAECDASQTPQKRYLRGMGISHMQTMEDQRYHTFHTDEKGSTAYITGENSRIENSYRYDAFGNLLETQEETENRILYTGQQYDRETEQYYLRARYYNPMIGRFIQEDTYHGDGLNLYAYCKNNPVTYYDPSGHDAMADAFAGYKKTKTGMVDGSVGGSKSGKTTNIDGAINNGQPLNNHRIVPESEAKKLPVTEVPNSSADLLNPDGSVKQRRYFGADGKVQMDIDFNHTDDGTHEFPHIHIWDWTKKPPRQDSRR